MPDLKTAEWLIDQGATWVLISILCFICWKLWYRIKQLEKEQAEMTSKVLEALIATKEVTSRVLERLR